MKILDYKGNVTAFVYGTLMRGFPNERVIMDLPHDVYEAEIRGAELYDVGSFPAMVFGKESYKGEFIVFDSSLDPDFVHMRMDRLEGYRKDSPESSLYLREKVTVYVDGKPVETEAYIWNHSCADLVYIDPKKYSGYKEYIQDKRSRVYEM